MKNKKFFILLFLVMLSSCVSQSVNDIWTNPYVPATTIEEIVDLRGQPFDVTSTNEGHTELTFYSGFSKSNGWQWVPYVNMIAAGITVWIVEEVVIVGADGKYLSAEGSVNKEFNQMFVGLAKEISVLSDDYQEEAARVELFMTSQGRSFDKKNWEYARQFKRTLSNM